MTKLTVKAERGEGVLRMSGKNAPRVFDFDREVTLFDAIRTIQSALQDEGLTLTDSDNGSGSRITSVLVDGVKRVIVPAHRITALA